MIQWRRGVHGIVSREKRKREAVKGERLGRRRKWVAGLGVSGETQAQLRDLVLCCVQFTIAHVSGLGGAEGIADARIKLFLNLQRSSLQATFHGE